HAAGFLLSGPASYALLLSPAQLLTRILPPDQLLNPCQQFFGMKRFGEKFEIVAALLGILQNLHGFSLAGEEQNMTAWKLPANRDCQLNAIHAWHYHIADDQVRNLLPEDGKR